MVSPKDHTSRSNIEQKISPKSIVNRLNESVLQTTASMIDGESSDHITPNSPAIAEFFPDSYSSSSSSSISSISFDSNNDHNHSLARPELLQTFSSSSGYDSSLTSIPDHLLSSSPPSHDCHFVEQFLHLQLDTQTSSPPSSYSSLSSQEPYSTITSPTCCRKCLDNHHLSSDTDDDSQSTTISTDYLSSQVRPRSLPIAIQQPKNGLNDEHTEIDSSLCQCTSETSASNEKYPLEHFIMSPTDRVKVQMKYEENDMKYNDLKISQPEEIDFKRSKLKAMRVLYQNRLDINSISSSPVEQQKSKIVANQTDLSATKRTSNPKLMRSITSCSVFEVDDEHEVVSTTRTDLRGKQRKSPIEIYHGLRVNFIESLLHGKILPCGILDGFTVKLGASGLFLPKQVVLPVTTFWFDVSEHQAASAYLGFINLQSLPKRGYQTPIKGTITLALLNPNGTAIHLFLILYDFSDMPADHRTFIRQRILLIPEHTSDKKENLRYLAHIRFVTSQTGKLYMHSDIRLIFARNKLDYDERTGNGRPQLVTHTDIPTPKYWPRK